MFSCSSKLQPTVEEQTLLSLFIVCLQDWDNLNQIIYTKEWQLELKQDKWWGVRHAGKGHGWNGSSTLSSWLCPYLQFWFLKLKRWEWKKSIKERKGEGGGDGHQGKTLHLDLQILKYLSPCQLSPVTACYIKYSKCTGGSLNSICQRAEFSMWTIVKRTLVWKSKS